ncbi:hypothetical protein FGU65_05360 [Methanoculleus sp. FWC-SCC1]|uniref:Uncharacterized protein n=1 Tax=Methanoculleus frigidifontis TaxID=2584085 RepID=A0ABT8M8R0_9EURY|nr:hypothetical protein [Methanoculleus sp. FWC-SCC1]MDN7024323.1 hypothetical protein [Methanoculleus sp. FWC-SCC1]
MLFGGNERMPKITRKARGMPKDIRRFAKIRRELAAGAARSAVCTADRKHQNPHLACRIPILLFRSDSSVRTGHPIAVEKDAAVLPRARTPPGIEWTADAWDIRENIDRNLPCGEIAKKSKREVAALHYVLVRCVE